MARAVYGISRTISPGNETLWSRYSTDYSAARPYAYRTRRSAEIECDAMNAVCEKYTPRGRQYRVVEIPAGRSVRLLPEK